MADAPPAVLVIGDVMLDIIAAPTRAIELATDTPAEITLVPGGSAANQAAWLGYFGNTVRFVGRVGHAGAAEHVAALRAHGVQPFLACDERVRTGVTVTLIGAAGERSFLTDRGANARLARGDLADGLLDDLDLVHVSGYALLGPGPRAAVRDFLAAATARRVPFSVDAASVAFLRDVGAAAFFDWTAAATLCFTNAAEAAILTGSTDPNEQLDRLADRYANVIVTGGAAGACAATQHGSQRWSVIAPTVQPVDTSGAGDAFLAGFLSAYLRGAPFEDSLRSGVRAGSSAVLHYGGRPLAPVDDTRV